MSPLGHGGQAGDEFDIFGPLERSGVARGIVLVIAAVIVGAVLLPSATRPPLSSAATAATTTPTSPSSPSSSSGSEAPPSSTSTTSTAPVNAPPSSIKVLVANGTNSNGAAAAVSSFLNGKGFGTLSPVDALTTVSASQVYAVGGATAAARQVATALGLSASAVEPSTQPIPVSSVGNATVVVIVGPDLTSRA
ncbi:MAG TPA: hypothetical protein DCQ30_13865 [Acidimicrobiaceae bacterium]|nr:hypothetical protein [Acidimicrobiaceae bacterium]